MLFDFLIIIEEYLLSPASKASLLNHLQLTAAPHALYIKPIWPFEVEGLWRDVSYCSFHCRREKGRKKNKKRGEKAKTSETERRNTIGQSSEFRQR